MVFGRIEWTITRVTPLPWESEIFLWWGAHVEYNSCHIHIFVTAPVTSLFLTGTFISEITIGPLISTLVDISQKSSKAVLFPLSFFDLFTLYTLKVSHLHWFAPLQIPYAAFKRYPDVLSNLFKGQHNWRKWRILGRKTLVFSNFQTENHQTQKALRLCKTECPLYWNMKIEWLIFTQWNLPKCKLATYNCCIVIVPVAPTDYSPDSIQINLHCTFKLIFATLESHWP